MIQLQPLLCNYYEKIILTRMRQHREGIHSIEGGSHYTSCLGYLILYSPSCPCYITLYSPLWLRVMLVAGALVRFCCKINLLLSWARPWRESPRSVYIWESTCGFSFTIVRKWRRYLLGQSFIIKIDQQALNYLLD